MDKSASVDLGHYCRKVETIENGFVTPFRISASPERISGCVYGSDGLKVAISERAGGILGDRILSANPAAAPRPASARRLKGRGVYLGQFMSRHFGHFMYETLSTFWIFEQTPAREFDYFLFHPLTFGSAIVDLNRFCFERFGIDPAKVIVVADEPLLVDHLVVPERLAQLNHSADPSLRWVYDAIARRPEGTMPSRRLYISRRVFNATFSRRVIANEIRVENLFRQAGFEIFYPELVSFAEQVATCSQAAVIAGMSGSNLLNVHFAARDALLIEIGDPRYQGKPNPCLPPAAGVARARHRFIPFVGRVFGPRMTVLVDIDHLTEAVEPILREDLAQGGDRLALSRPAFKASDMAEVCYRCVRPTAGYLARVVARGLRGGPMPA